MSDAPMSDSEIEAMFDELEKLRDKVVERLKLSITEFEKVASKFRKMADLATRKYEKFDPDREKRAATKHLTREEDGDFSVDDEDEAAEIYHRIDAEDEQLSYQADELQTLASRAENTADELLPDAIQLIKDGW